MKKRKEQESNICLPGVFYENETNNEEYDALDEALTRNPPRIIANGSDWLSQL